MIFAWKKKSKMRNDWNEFIVPITDKSLPSKLNQKEESSNIAFELKEYREPCSNQLKFSILVRTFVSKSSNAIK